jgi:hypothetical protein
METDTSGVVRFSRFAYPPHVRGLCGPDEEATITSLASGERIDPDPAAFAAFEGAFPYLQLIASASGIGDPLDRRVVDAYWLGMPPADSIDLHDVGHHVRDRFRPRMGLRWPTFADVLEEAPRPTHGFHVLCVYPWLRSLREGSVQPSLTVLDRCRIRPAEVVAVDGSSAEVRSRPLEWDGRALSLGAGRTEMIEVLPGLDVVAGDVVAAHWDWACDILGPSSLRALVLDTRRSIHLANGVAVEPTG